MRQHGFLYDVMRSYKLFVSEKQVIPRMFLLSLRHGHHHSQEPWSSLKQRFFRPPVVRLTKLSSCLYIQIFCAVCTNTDEFPWWSFCLSQFHRVNWNEIGSLTHTLWSTVKTFPFYFYSHLYSIEIASVSVIPFPLYLKQRLDSPIRSY